MISLPKATTCGMWILHLKTKEKEFSIPNTESDPGKGGKWDLSPAPNIRTYICYTIDSWASEYIKPEDCVIIHLEPTVQKVNTLRGRRNRIACDNRATPRCAPVNDQSPGPATGTLPGEPFEMLFFSPQKSMTGLWPLDNCLVIFWYLLRKRKYEHERWAPVNDRSHGLATGTLPQVSLLLFIWKL